MFGPSEAVSIGHDRSGIVHVRASPTSAVRNHRIPKAEKTTLVKAQTADCVGHELYWCERQEFFVAAITGRMFDDLLRCENFIVLNAHAFADVSFQHERVQDTWLPSNSPTWHGNATVSKVVDIHATVPSAK